MTVYTTNRYRIVGRDAYMLSQVIANSVCASGRTLLRKLSTGNNVGWLIPVRLQQRLQEPRSRPRECKGASRQDWPSHAARAEQPSHRVTPQPCHLSHRLPAGTKQEYISETSGTLPGNHPVILLYIPRDLASEISPIHPYYFRPRGLQSPRL